MKRVTGIGGIFFQARDPAALRAWYKTHLGIDVQSWGGAAFAWADDDGNPVNGTTAWTIGTADGSGYGPAKAPFMVNYRVDEDSGCRKCGAHRSWNDALEGGGGKQRWVSAWLEWRHVSRSPA